MTTEVSAAHLERAGREGGLEFYDLSHPFGVGAPLWPSGGVYAAAGDVQLERVTYHSKSGVLTQRLSTHMHVTTHSDAPAHVIEGKPYIDQLPLSSYFGTGVVVSIPKEQWEEITPEDLENAKPEIRPGDIVIINSGWHRYYGDNQKYFLYSPGPSKAAGVWFKERGVKAVGVDQQALDHPLGTAIVQPPNGPMFPRLVEEYKDYTGRDVYDDFHDWEPCHRELLGNGIVGFENVGGDIDKVTGKRCTFAAFPWKWTQGDGCIVRLVAMLDPSGEYRIETGNDE